MTGWRLALVIALWADAGAVLVLGAIALVQWRRRRRRGPGDPWRTYGKR